MLISNFLCLHHSKEEMYQVGSNAKGKDGQQKYFGLNQVKKPNTALICILNNSNLLAI